MKEGKKKRGGQQRVRGVLKKRGSLKKEKRGGWYVGWYVCMGGGV